MMTAHQFERIHKHALRHVLGGGGVTSNQNLPGIEATIEDVANELFGLKHKQAKLDATLRRVPNQNDREAIDDAAMAEALTMMEAGFVLGCAVGRLMAVGTQRGGHR
jgi:hypothetical protein